MKNYLSAPTILMITLMCVLMSAFVPQKFEGTHLVQATLEAASTHDLGSGKISDISKINFFIPNFIHKKEVISTDVVQVSYKWFHHPSKTRPERLHTCGSLSPPS